MTKPTKQRSLPEPSAEALLNTAREYHLAATTLFSLRSDAESPLYFLYTHAMELALKAYLRSHRSPVRRIHDLRVLIQTCQEIGLRMPLDLTNVIDLLESENSLHGVRYLAFTSTSKPELTYLREVVDALMANVVDEVTQRPSDDLPTAGVFKFTVGKPEKK